MRWWLEWLYILSRLGQDTTRQVAAVLDWTFEIAKEDDRVIVAFPNYRRGFYFEFPLRHGDHPRGERKSADLGRATFVIRKPENDLLPEGNWVKIFIAPLVEVYERRSRISGAPPLRWKLDAGERKAALGVARKTLERFLETGIRPDQKEFRDLPSRLHFMADLDVALWIDGRLRGSHVVENRPLWEGIVEAAIGASRDGRFKPVEFPELEHARIEITLFSSPRVPLTESDKKRNRILPEKGYCLTYRSAMGWYLPEVFNVRRFRMLNELVENLAQEKAGISYADAHKADVSIFEVDDFIESSDHSRALPLWGPVVQENSEFSIKNLELRLRMAADWLCNIQQPSGNIPPIIDPLTGRETQIDWPRLALTAWALAELGNAQGEKAYRNASEKTFHYLKRFLLDTPLPLSAYNRHLSLVYMGQLAISLGEHKGALAAATAISSSTGLAFEPILFSQIASFFAEYAKSDSRYLTHAQHYAGIANERFKKEKREKAAMPLALWAELANSFMQLAEITNQEQQQMTAEGIFDWLEGQQLANGAFPESTVSDFAYTRGTSKILEVLARHPQNKNAVLNKALLWLLSMQFNDDSSFFVGERLRPRLMGAFRHDYLNQEAWIDSAAHFILGGAALLKRS